VAHGEVHEAQTAKLASEYPDKQSQLFPIAYLVPDDDAVQERQFAPEVTQVAHLGWQIVHVAPDLKWPFIHL